MPFSYMCRIVIDFHGSALRPVCRSAHVPVGIILPVDKKIPLLVKNSFSPKKNPTANGQQPIANSQCL